MSTDYIDILVYVLVYESFALLFSENLISVAVVTIAWEADITFYCYCC